MNRSARTEANAAISLSLDYQDRRRTKTALKDPNCRWFSDPSHECTDANGAPLREGVPCHIDARAEIEAEAARRARMSDEQRRAEDAHLERDDIARGKEWAAGGPVYRYVDGAR